MEIIEAQVSYQLSRVWTFSGGTLCDSEHQPSHQTHNYLTILFNRENGGGGKGWWMAVITSQSSWSSMTKCSVFLSPVSKWLLAIYSSLIPEYRNEGKCRFEDSIMRETGRERGRGVTLSFSPSLLLKLNRLFAEQIGVWSPCEALIGLKEEPANGAAVYRSSLCC